MTDPNRTLIIGGEARISLVPAEDRVPRTQGEIRRSDISTETRVVIIEASPNLTTIENGA